MPHRQVVTLSLLLLPLAFAGCFDSKEDIEVVHVPHLPSTFKVAYKVELDSTIVGNLEFRLAMRDEAVTPSGGFALTPILEADLDLPEGRTFRAYNWGCDGPRWAWHDRPESRQWILGPDDHELPARLLSFAGRDLKAGMQVHAPVGGSVSIFGVDGLRAIVDESADETPDWTWEVEWEAQSPFPVSFSGGALRAKFVRTHWEASTTLLECSIADGPERHVAVDWLGPHEGPATPFPTWEDVRTHLLSQAPPAQLALWRSQHPSGRLAQMTFESSPQGGWTFVLRDPQGADLLGSCMPLVESLQNTLECTFTEETWQAGTRTGPFGGDNLFGFSNLDALASRFMKPPDRWEVRLENATAWAVAQQADIDSAGTRFYGRKQVVVDVLEGTLTRIDADAQERPPWNRS